MKRLLASLGALCAVRLLSAAPVPVDSAITAVTVYTDRAVVTRTGSLELPDGITELVFPNLPQALNPHSLQVSGRGTAEALILDVASRQTYVDFTPNARVKELEDQLHALQKQQRALEDEGGVLSAQGVMLDRMETALFAPPAKDVPRPDLTQFTNALTYLSEQRTRLVTARATLDDQREDLSNKLNAAQNQLNELRGAGGRGYQTVTVRVSAAHAGTLAVALSYTVPGASWVPSYDARVLSSDRAVQLGYFGVVRQSTGEDWKDVALTLSTARPGFGGAAPVLSAWNLDVFVPRLRGMPEMEKSEVDAKKDFGYLATNAASAARIGMEVQRTPLAIEINAELAAATIESAATSASFKIVTAASVPSDNSPQKVPITSVRLAAHPEYLTVPKRLATAFLTAKVFNTSDFPLLGGAMNVFLDGTFVATSGLRTVMPGEKFDLALGADEGIAVKYKRVNKFTEETGLTNSGQRITYEYLLTVQNNKRTTEHVIVADQVPLSRNEKIVVKLLSPDAKEVKPTDEGILKWGLDLQPGEKRELTVKFAVEYANEVNVAGLE